MAVGGVAFGAAVTLASAPASAEPLDFLSANDMDARALLTIGISTGVIAFSVVVAMLGLRAMRRGRAAEARARMAAGDYDRRADFFNAVLAAEPQFLIHWNEAGEPAVVADTLASDLGIPRDIGNALKFNSWLERDSALELENRTAALRSEGQPFNLMLKTTAATYVEADGRAAGGGSVLKFRDLAGRRAELADVAEQHRRLGHDIDRMRAVLDALPAPVWMHGADGRIEWVNRAYVRAVEALDARQVYASQIALLDASRREAAKRAANAGEAFRSRVELSSSGETQLYDIVVLEAGPGRAGFATPVQRSGGEPELGGQYVGQTPLLDRISTATIIFSASQRLTYFNAAFARLWDLDPEWLAARPLDGEVLDKLREERRLPEQADYRAWKSGRLKIYDDGRPRDERWHLPDGRTVQVIAERGSDGSVTYLYENLTETLALKSRYNALMHVQKETLDHLGEGVAVYGSDGRLKLFNPSFAAIWNLDAQELDNEPHIDRVIQQSRGLFDGEDIWSELHAAVTSIDDEREPIEGQIERADGVFLAYAGLPLPDGGTLLTYVDISDTKRMEHALIERNEALVAADRLKSAFISHVSYELRTPLTNIIGFAELLDSPATGPLNEKQREYLGDISSSSDSLLAIINDILDMATIDAGNLELRIVRSSAKDVIDAAIVGVRDRLARSNIGLDLRIEAGSEQFMADSKRMTQVIYNLLSNAIGFSEPGSRVSVQCRRAGPWIEIAVEDEGAGIPPDYQQAAFDRFESRPHGSRHRGAGLGLAIVKSVVELHGGYVELLSAPDEGTRVTVRFPAVGPSARETTPGSGDAAAASPTAAE